MSPGPVALLLRPSSTRAGYPLSGGLHELAAPKMHSRHVTMPLVSSYLTFSPFLPRRTVVIFFCITQPLRTASTLGSGMPCAARTFLFQLFRAASDRPPGCFLFAKNARHHLPGISSCWRVEGGTRTHDIQNHNLTL